MIPKRKKRENDLDLEDYSFERRVRWEGGNRKGKARCGEIRQATNEVTAAAARPAQNSPTP